MTTILLFLFVINISISTYNSLAPEISFDLWDRYMKSFMLMFMILVLINNKVRIHSVIWIIVVSVGYYSVQGGLIGILSGGNTNIVGPPSSQIEDNNHMALAMVITMPLLNYLRMHSAVKMVRFILAVSLMLSTIAVLSTYSRGGLIGLLVMLGFWWLRSRHKVVTVIVALFVLVTAVQFMPQKWMDRMGTIETASEKDSSFQSRLAAWETSFNLAVASPILGGGLSATESQEVYTLYRPSDDQTLSRAAHSIYFQVLGDLGFVGLTIYLFLLYSGWRNSFIVIRICSRNKGLDWAADLARMSQVSVGAFCVAGAALSMAYYDVFLTIIVLQSSLRILVEKQVAQSAIDSNRPVFPVGRTLNARSGLQYD